jgi:hypothetical protein
MKIPLKSHHTAWVAGAQTSSFFRAAGHRGSGRFAGMPDKDAFFGARCRAAAIRHHGKLVSTGISWYGETVDIAGQEMHTARNPPERMKNAP